jgi:putative transposase
MEQTDEWTEARRYMGPEILAKARLRLIGGESVDQNTTPQAIIA